MARHNKIGEHKTSIYTDNGFIIIKYHETDVVKFNYDKIILDSGEWRTHTTKTRMNQASNQFGLGFGVYQKDYQWYVYVWATGESLDFFDGMEIKRDFSN